MMIQAGLFSNQASVQSVYGGDGTHYGLLLGGGWYQLGMQLVGLLALLLWAGGCSTGE